MITITSKQDGFRRAGINHSATPADYPDDAFTPEQLVALRAEPMLVVVEAPDAKPNKKPKDDKSSKPVNGEAEPPDPDAAPAQGDSQK